MAIRYAFEQIFSNLITNASKYSHPGDHIDISMREHDANAEIVFSDTGIGIEPEALENIFIPFRQLGIGTGTAKGLGIGLALVRSFVEIHTAPSSYRAKEQTKEANSRSLFLFSRRKLLLLLRKTHLKRKNSRVP